MGESVSFSIFLKDYFSKSLSTIGARSNRTFDNVEKDIDDVERKSKKAAQGMSASFGGAFSTIGKLAATLGVTIGAATAVIRSANMGIQAEQTEVAFTTMIGSADKAKAAIADLSTFASETPYGNREVLGAGKQLLAFGFQSDELKGKLGQLGDVASALGQPLSDMAYLYGTIRTQGKAMTQDLNQFANRGVPIFEEVAKVLGIGKDQVRDFAEEGLISAKVIEAAFTNMTASGGKFYNMMAAQSQTAGGRLATMMDNLEALGRKIGLAMLPAINAFVDLGSTILEKIAPIVDAVAPAFEWFGNNFENILTVVTPLVAVFTAWAAITKVVTVAQWALNVAMAANPVGLIVAGIALLIGGLVLAYKKSETFRQVLAGLWASIQVGWEYVKQFALFAWEWVPMFAAIRHAIAFLGKAFTMLWPIVKNVFAKIKDWISETFGGVFTWITDRIKEFIGFIGKIADALGITAIIDKITGAFKKGAEAQRERDKAKREAQEQESPESGDAISSISQPVTMTGIAEQSKKTAKKGAGEKLVGVSADERAARNITVQIDKLIGELSFNATTFQESVTDLREKVKQVLIDAVRDAELSF